MNKHQTTLIEENQRLRKALMFYANPCHYPVPSFHTEFASKAIRDQGEIARKALQDNQQNLDVGRI